VIVYLVVEEHDYEGAYVDEDTKAFRTLSAAEAHKAALLQKHREERYPKLPDRQLHFEIYPIELA
jgi:hypothetical protein